MARRRFLTAAQLAPELDADVDDVLAAVRAGQLLILAPPRRVVSRIPPRGERGGGYDLTGALAWAQADVHDWLSAYLSRCAPVDDPVRAAKAGRPFHDGLRLYVRPDAMASEVGDLFNPALRVDRVRRGLEEMGAVRGRVLGLDPDTDGGRLVWWRVPSHVRIDDDTKEGS